MAFLSLGHAFSRHTRKNLSWVCLFLCLNNNDACSISSKAAININTK